jgi:ABC-type methionine transport system ATPase subunit
MTNSPTLKLDDSKHNRPTQTRIRIRIPQKYQDAPVISNLASHHNLDINILAAVLGKNGIGDGWFDLQLNGHSEQIDSALIYLSELDIEVWYESNREQDGW